MLWKNRNQGVVTEKRRIYIIKPSCPAKFAYELHYLQYLSSSSSYLVLQKEVLCLVRAACHALKYSQLYKQFFISSIFEITSALPEEVSRTFHSVKDVDVDISEI